MNSFSNEIEEITLLVKEDQLAIKSYVENTGSDKAKTIVNTQVTFEKDEFECYEIDEEADITFCLKEFKICLLFGSTFDLSLGITYERRGRPIIFSYGVNDVFEVNYTLATLNEDSSTQMTTSNYSQNSIIINNNTLLDSTTMIVNPKSSQIASRSNTNSNIENKIQKPTNKRTLFDASNNQSYFDDPMDADTTTINAKKVSQNAKKVKDADEYSDSDSRESNNSGLNRNNLRETPNKFPPSKKLKSLIHSMFDENDNHESEIENNEDAKKLNDFTTNKQQQNTTVYIEETDSSDSDSESD